MMKLKYWTIMTLFLVTAILNFFIYWMVYLNRDFIRSNKEKWFFWLLWLCLNDTKKQSEKDIDFGDYGRFKHNIIGAYRQSVFRNPTWNLRNDYFNPKKGKIEAIIPLGGRLQWYNSDKPYEIGRQYVEYYIDGTWYFRESYFLPLNKYNPARLLGYKYKNMMRGASGNRYLFKFKYKK